MKHLIIGVGTVGDATGYVLEQFGEDVSYRDIDLKKTKGRKLSDYQARYDVYWVCTAEWDVEKVLEFLKYIDRIVVVRSTVSPTFIDEMQEKYHLKYIAHIPEFLREKYARKDAENPERIIVGTYSYDVAGKLAPLLQCFNVPIEFVNPTESALIKLMSNAYLAAQISYWNEMKRICKQYKVVRPETVVRGCIRDSRISKYGTNLRKGPFAGACLPKDLNTLISVARNCKLLTAVREVNDDEATSG